MDSRTEERVKDWDSRPFSAGYEDLRDLADDEFSGAVEAAGATLFMLNGRVVGIPGGDMASFEDASGTIYEAPDPSLPLLFAMREQGGDERAKYYTNDTPISEADDTLSSGTFTGYIELSENVLSGDYYVVYYGGRSMSCAFVGNSEQLITGDEAFDRADDEVGIYTVWDVDIEVTDIPEPEGADDAAGAGAGAAAGSGDAAGAGAGAAGADGTGAGGPGAGAAGAGASAGAADADSVDDPAPSEGVDQSVDGAASGASGAGSADRRTDETVREATDDAVAAPSADDAPVDRDDSSVVDEAEPAGGGRSTDDVDDGRRTGAREDVRDAEAGDARGGDRGDSSRSGRTDDAEGRAMAEVPDEVMAEVEDEAQTTDLAEEMAWRETTTIPSINPERTTESESEDPLASASSGSSRSGDASNSRASGTQNASGTRTGTSGTERARTKGGNRSQGSGGRTAGGGGGVDPERVQAIEDELEDVREERDAIASERDELEVERDELRERNRELQSRVEELEGEVSDLESELADVRDQLAADGSSAANASVELTPREALEGTNLFVRYGSKSETTMEDVHDRDVGIADLESNLRLEYHTGFDAADAVVDGQPYDDFLYDSTPYRFVEWFVYDLVFEVRDTGNESALGDLYEAFPKVDRIELYGDVSLRYEEDGKEQREQTTFDVVVRDRMGNPIAVANVNDGREPATEDMMVDLQERASRVKRTSDALAGAFMVTASYFEPGALETADEATSGSLLRRDSKKSYVKLSRKQGYHLCLVETRNAEFHVNVPEL